MIAKSFYFTLGLSVTSFMPMPLTHSLPTSSIFSPIPDRPQDIQSSEEYLLEQQRIELEQKQREQQEIMEAKQEEERLKVIAQERRRLNMFGSVAYSPSSDKVWLITEENSEENARASALKSCGQDDCYIVKVFRDCAVVYETFDGSRFNVAEGRSLDEAMKNSEIGFFSAILAGCTESEAIAYERQTNDSGYYDNGYNDSGSTGGIDPTGDGAHHNWEECGDWAGC